MLIAKREIKSALRGNKVYAMVGDSVQLLWQSTDVGCFMNLETKETFPAMMKDVEYVPDNIKLPKEREFKEAEENMSKKGRSKSKNYNQSQQLLF